MKKTRFIALALVVAIAMMGAGYALWSEALLVDTTVRTGKFDIEITNPSLRTGDFELKNEIMNWHTYDWTSGDYNNGAKVTNSGNSLIVEAGDIYPGGAVRLDMTMVNKGTIPAKIKSIEVTPVYESVEGLFGLMQAKSSMNIDIDGTEDANGKLKNEKYWANNEWVGLQTAMNKMVNATNENNFVIEPNGSIHFGIENEPGCIEFRLSPNAGNQYQNATCRFKITFNWEQWASDPTVNPYDGPNGYGGDGKLPGVGNN